MHRLLPKVRQESLGQHRHTLPRQPVPLASPVQGMPTGADNLTAKGLHLWRVTVYKEIRLSSASVRAPEWVHAGTRATSRGAP